ncbi:MAG: PEP-CTERM sorting domain-containing protein [Phycisphaerales bacterium]|nr:PEP-CTERM sorting domain-containing protein [Phycisphaerales bacterium]MCB9856419.1 PEP-CTERM sorting domain-containing protein [Phycisphaerales bacterium]MCB9864550.1 PEP-CTERM sorting domain-containing protein [Phycisphaerales bacterium]
MSRKSLTSRALGLVCCLLVVDTYASVASLRGLGDLPGGNFESYAIDISADGTVVVGTGTTANGRRAFRWTAAGGMEELSGAPVGATQSFANAVSANGEVIVGIVLVDGVNYGFRWTQADGMVLYGSDYQIGIFRSDAIGVSHDGTTVVGEIATATFSKAVRWDVNGNATMIEDPPCASSAAICTSADGRIVAGTCSIGIAHAFRWSQATGLDPFGLLVNPTRDSYGFGMSSTGTTVVGEIDSNGDTRAFRWNAETGLVLLGDPMEVNPGPAWAYDVTADGTKIVGVDYGLLPGSAVALWGPDGNVRSLYEILTVDYGQNLTGWRLIQGLAISDNGAAIVGYGLDPAGYTEAWIARFPASTCGCPGDVDHDGLINGNDIPAFIDCLVDDSGDCLCANTDGLAGVSMNDVSYFATTLVTGAACP